MIASGDLRAHLWLVVLGFVVNRAGELEVTGPADFVPLLALGAAALLTSSVSR